MECKQLQATWNAAFDFLSHEKGLNSSCSLFSTGPTDENGLPRSLEARCFTPVGSPWFLRWGIIRYPLHLRFFHIDCCTFPHPFRCEFRNILYILTSHSCYPQISTEGSAYTLPHAIAEEVVPRVRFFACEPCLGIVSARICSLLSSLFPFFLTTPQPSPFLPRQDRAPVKTHLHRSPGVRLPLPPTSFVHKEPAVA